jgi:hypothetical protein
LTSAPIAKSASRTALAIAAGGGNGAAFTHTLHAVFRVRPPLARISFRPVPPFLTERFGKACFFW